MTKEELQQALVAKGIVFDKRWSVKTLQTKLDELSTPSEVLIETAKESILGTDVPTIEEIVEGSVQVDEGRKLKSGLILPTSALMSLRPTVEIYRVSATSDAARVYKLPRSGQEEFVREYTAEIHGENFLALAEQFAKKFNK